MECRVFLDGMDFYAYHGCYATERRVGGRFRVYVSYVYDCGGLVGGDDVTRGVSYLDVYERVRSEMMLVSNTVEHVASRILGRLFDDFGLMVWCEVRIEKLSPPLGGDVLSAGVVLSVSR